jgi:hypothetical protein
MVRRGRDAQALRAARHGRIIDRLDIDAVLGEQAIARRLALAGPAAAPTNAHNARASGWQASDHGSSREEVIDMTFRNIHACIRPASAIEPNLYGYRRSRASAGVSSTLSGTLTGFLGAGSFGAGSCFGTTAGFGITSGMSIGCEPGW